MDDNPDQDFMQNRKFYIIMNVKTSMDCLVPETVNACWPKLRPDCVKDFAGFPYIEEGMNENVGLLFSLVERYFPKWSSKK